MSVLKKLTEEYFGKTERLEDTREFIDFGGKTTVLWAKYSLEIDGKSNFYFDEVKDFNKGGWRLPTRKEVKEIFKSGVWDCRYRNKCKVIKFPKGRELNVKINEFCSVGFHMWTKDEDDRFEAPAAWAYGFNNMYEFYIDSYNTSYNMGHALLVKDKKKE